MGLLITLYNQNKGEYSTVRVSWSMRWFDPKMLQEEWERWQGDIKKEGKENG